MLTELAEAWPAKAKWTIDKLLLSYGDIAFRISQKSSKKIAMKFKDYVSYMEVQHDEDPLYIFDDKVLICFSDSYLIIKPLEKGEISVWFL